MELTVLGKYGPYGKAGVGAASGYLVTDGDFKILCDMGSGVLSRLINAVDVRQLDGIYISHLHYDHTSDLLPFRYLLEEIEKPVTIYTHRENSEWYNILFNHPLFNMVDTDENTVLDVRGVKMEFFKMNHAITDYAVKFTGSGKLLYTGDTAYTDAIIDAGKDCDVILADCSKPTHFIGAHMTADKAIILQEKTGARVIATHLSPDYTPEEIFEGKENIYIAEEGKTYRI